MQMLYLTALQREGIDNVVTLYHKTFPPEWRTENWKFVFRKNLPIIAKQSTNIFFWRKKAFFKNFQCRTL